MTTRIICQCVIAFLLVSTSVMSQEIQQDPRAAKALAKVVLEKDFGKFKFQKREIVTMKENNQVPGLNGLMFAYYKDPAGPRIMLSVQWFSNEKDLLAFYRSHLKKQEVLKGTPLEDKMFKKRKFADTTILSIGDAAYLWTDGKHLMFSMGGAAIPPEMSKAYLALVPSRVAEIKKEKKNKQPDATDKEQDPK